MHADFSSILSACSELPAGWMAALWRASWQGGLVLLAVWIATHAWRQIPPLFRVWAWRAAYLKLLLTLCWTGAIILPVLPAHWSHVPPPVPLSVPELMTAQALPENETVHTATMPALTPTRIPATSPMLQPVTSPVTLPVPTLVVLPAKPSLWQRIAGAMTANRSYWPAAIAFCWLFGVAWGCGSLALAAWQAGRLRRNSIPVTDAEILTLLQELSGMLGLCHAPELRAGVANGPLLLGPLRPVILIPAPLLATSNREALRLMMAHELAHLRQRDLCWGWLAAGVELLFFFHPLVRLSAHDSHLAQEMACDALAVRSTAASRAAYGAMLAETAASCAHFTQPSLMAVGMSESFRTLQQRIVVMKHRTRLSRKQLAVIICLTVLIAFAVIIPWRLARYLNAHENVTVQEAYGLSATANLRDGSIRYEQAYPGGGQYVAFELAGKNYPPEHLLANAITLGDAALVKALVTRTPAWVRTADSVYGLPLLQAVTSRIVYHGLLVPFDKAGVVKVLLNAGADPDVEKSNGTTPRYLALLNHQHEIAALLKAHGGKVLLKSSPFMTAVSEGDLPTVKRMLAEHPAIVNEIDAYGRMPLALAVNCEQRDIAALLMKNDAKVRRSDPDHIHR